MNTLENIKQLGYKLKKHNEKCNARIELIEKTLRKVNIKYEIWVKLPISISLHKGKEVESTDKVEFGWNTNQLEWRHEKLYTWEAKPKMCLPMSLKNDAPTWIKKKALDNIEALYEKIEEELSKHLKSIEK